MWLGYDVDVHTKHGGVSTPTAKIGFYLGTWAGAGNVRIDIVMSCMRVCRKQALSRVKYYYYVINSKIQQQQ